MSDKRCCQGNTFLKHNVQSAFQTCLFYMLLLVLFASAPDCLWPIRFCHDFLWPICLLCYVPGVLSLRLCFTDCSLFFLLLLLFIFSLPFLLFFLVVYYSSRFPICFFTTTTSTTRTQHMKHSDIDTTTTKQRRQKQQEHNMMMTMMMITTTTTKTTRTSTDHNWTMSAMFLRHGKWAILCRHDPAVVPPKLPRLPTPQIEIILGVKQAQHQSWHICCICVVVSLGVWCCVALYV